MIQSRTSGRFWKYYDQLPEHIRVQADKQFALFKRNPQHPSLRLKLAGQFWSVRVTSGYRALAIRDGSVFSWFWIGAHDEYEAILHDKG